MVLALLVTSLDTVQEDLSSLWSSQENLSR